MSDAIATGQHVTVLVTAAKAAARAEALGEAARLIDAAALAATMDGKPKLAAEYKLRATMIRGL